MKKTAKQFLIAGTVLCIAGLFLFGVGTAAGGKEYVKDADLNVLNGAATMTSSDHHAILEKTEIEPYTTVNADLRNIDLKIQPSPDDKYYISYNVETTDGLLPVSCQVSDGTLNLAESRGNSSYSYIHVDINFLRIMLGQSNVIENQNNVVLYIPTDKELDSFSCRMGDGTLSADSLNSRKVQISSDLGDIELKNTSIQDGNISLSEGDLTGKNITVSGAASVNTSLGDISLSMPQDVLKQLSLNASTSLGDIDCPDSLKGTLTGDDDEQDYSRTTDSKNSLDIKSSEGDITITEAE